MGALDDGERISAADAAVWRAWLVANHARAAGVWLLNVRGAQADGVAYEEAVRQALCFGWIDGPPRANWDAFPKSARKLGLTCIAMAKREETRATRIAKLVADAAEGKRP